MRHWVFDLDGTLVDSFSHYFAFLEETFRGRGIEFDERLKHEALTEPLVSYFGRYFGKHRVDELIARVHARSIADAEKVLPFEGIPETLETLASRGSRLAVLTNRDIESARIILRTTGLDRFTEACLSGSCVQRKPSTEGILKLADRFGCRPDELTVVGDHDHDVDIAKATGARAVRVSWHSYWPVSPCDRADHHFHRVSDFSSWIQAHGN